MRHHMSLVLPRAVMVISVLGVGASIATLDGSTRWLFIVVAACVATAAAGYLQGLKQMPNLVALSERPAKTLDDELGAAEEIWCSWHTGGVKAAQGDLMRKPRRIRMVLTHPDCSALSEVAKIANMSANDMAPGIRALTTAVKDAGGEVAWFDGPVGNSITIADPNKPTGWVRIEVLLPFGDPASRPSLVAHAKDSPEVFARAKLAFERLYHDATLQ